MRGKVVALCLILSLSAFSQEYYCLQLVSSPNFEEVKKLFKYVTTLPEARIEKIGDSYTIRVGFFKELKTAERYLRRVKDVFGDAFIRKCMLDPDRIVLPKWEPKRSKVFTYEVGMKLAQLYLKKKDFKKAERIYRELLEMHPDSREVALMLARVLYWQGKYDEALEIYRELEKFRPELSEERRKVEISKIMKEVERLEKEGKLDEAIKLLEKLYEEEKKNYDVGMKLGLLYIRTGRRQEAHRVFAALLEKYPHDRDIRQLFTITAPVPAKARTDRKKKPQVWNT